MKKKAIKVLKKKVVFSKGPIHLVDCLVQLNSQQVVSRQIIEHPGAVVIIPQISKDSFILIRQFRFAARGWLWEWPAGGIEPGESLKKCAQRELMEETGFQPKKLSLISKFYPTPGISSEVMYLYLAEKLVPRSAEKDPDEEIEIHFFTLSEIGKMIRRGKIVDGKTILGYHLLKRLKG